MLLVNPVSTNRILLIKHRYKAAQSVTPLSVLLNKQASLMTTKVHDSCHSINLQLCVYALQHGNYQTTCTSSLAATASNITEGKARSSSTAHAAVHSMHAVQSVRYWGCC
jgi:hypothetical protein